MLTYLWPMALVVFANIAYNVSSKSLPRECSPFAALIVTYVTATLLSLAGFFLFETQRNLVTALRKVNWTGMALGFSMVGLEIGFIFLYRNGWKISTASLVANILLALALIAVGVLFYRERVALQQIVGTIVCLVGVAILMTARG